jgi:hypothetical protein
VGIRYNREKKQGARTDLHNGKPVSTAERIGKEHNISGRPLEACGRFADAMDYLREALSLDAFYQIMTQEAKISREEAIQLSSFQDTDTVVEIWEEWKQRAGTLAALIAKHHKDKKPPKPKTPKPATERYGLQDLVRLISLHWSPEALADAIEDGTVTSEGLGSINQHLGGALKNLIGIAEQTGHGLEVLDAWMDEQAEQENLGDQDEEDSGKEPAAVPEAPAIEQAIDQKPERKGKKRKADADQELRERH